MQHKLDGGDSNSPAIDWRLSLRAIIIEVNDSSSGVVGDVIFARSSISKHDREL